MAERAGGGQLREKRTLGLLWGEDALWPWISRFLWAPAVDLHPSRRDTLLPGWPEAAWSDPQVLAHPSHHLLQSHGLLRDVRCDSDAGEFVIALLPQALLTRLARRLGLAFAGTAVRAAEALEEGERAFLTRRLPLYWRAAGGGGEDCESSGWQALRAVMAGQPEAVRQRFGWKTPLEVGRPMSMPDCGALLALIGRILREYEEPWCYSFAMPRRPERQIRLRG
jgi:hypothetical protein